MSNSKEVKDKTIRVSPETLKVLKQYQLDFDIPTMNDVVRMLLNGEGY
ncbi:MAG: hypothetical protein JRJ85_21870 [Deltaproteobacteria bacterium]|nr:hypothetical protein [Deltaproteobacteria bacterium]